MEDFKEYSGDCDYLMIIFILFISFKWCIIFAINVVVPLARLYNKV